ncbi:HAD family hydrolase [Desulfovibrio sp. OttesenSCG-928-C14]|nr:HAD family hydrolase [Desulfovibrio sp. OttesenSCG-928-C14]
MPSDKPLLENVFLDRDGTIIHDRHYLSDPDGVELLPDAGPALARLARRGARLFMVTNQSGIGRGYFRQEEYLACALRLREILAGLGLALTGSVFCPHAPEEGCACRKPGIGMWERLCARHTLNSFKTVMLGDKAEDIGFGQNAGFAATILVLTGKGAQSAAALSLPEIPAGKSFLALDQAGAERAAGQAGPDCGSSASPLGQAVRPSALARDLSGAADFLEEYFSFPEKSIPAGQ